MLEVEDRRRGGRSGDERDHHAEGKVDRLERVEPELAAKRPAVEDPTSHRAHPAGRLRARRVALHNRCRQPVGGILRELGEEDAVLEPADPGQSTAELAGVGLGPADDPGDEREERDPDHPGILALTAP